MEVGGSEKKLVLFPHRQMKPSHGSACVAQSILSHVSRSGDASLQIEGPLACQEVRLILCKGKMEENQVGHWYQLTQACGRLVSKQAPWALT